MKNLKAWLLLALSLPVAAFGQIEYDLTPSPSAGVFKIEMRFKALAGTTTVRIPAWCPGFYNLRDYQNTISGLTFQTASGTPLARTQVDPRSWKFDVGSDQDVKVDYSVAAHDPGQGFFGSMLDDRIGFVNGASAYMYIDGRKTEEDFLKVELPQGWKLASPLDPSMDGPYKGDLEAKTGYDEFIDSPLQIGDFIEKDFKVDNIPYKAVFVTTGGAPRVDVDKLTQQLQTLSLPALKMFGSASFKHYMYLFHLKVGNFAGGLEHRACTTIALPDTAGMDMVDIAAHENFHAWNVKQIRPFLLGPFDYNKPARTANLWFAEGVTDYYAKILSYRSGLKDKAWLFSQFQDQISELQGSQSRKTVTLADCSKNTWDSDGFSYGDLSYYTKGLIAGLIFDSAIRSQTHGAQSLDDVMMAMYARYKLPQPGYAEDGILTALKQVGGPGMDRLYHELIESTDEVPYQILRSIGIQVTEPGVLVPILPFETNSDGFVTRLSQAAAANGIAIGDKVIKVEDTPWNGLSDQPTKEFKVTVTRGEKELIATVPYAYRAADSIEFVDDPSAGVAQKQLEDEWLKR